MMTGKGLKKNFDLIKYVNTICGIALTDYKYTRRKNKSYFVFLLMIIFLFLAFHSIADSVIQSISDLKNKPYGRVVTASFYAETRDDSMNNIKEMTKSLDGINQIFWNIGVVDAVWEKMENHEDVVDVSLITYIDTMQDYIISGHAPAEKGEIILPKYLYGLGDADSYSYIDGEEYVGKTIQLCIEDQNSGEWKEFQYKVAGCYNNLKCRTGNDMICLTEDDALEVFEYQRCRSEDIYIEQIKEMYDIQDESELNELRTRYSIGICISENADLEQTVESIEDITGEYWFAFMESDDTLSDYLTFVSCICDGISVLFAIMFLLCFLLMLWREMEKRRRDIVYRYVNGYSLGMQFPSLVIEKTLDIILAVLVSAILSQLVIVIGNFGIQNFLAFYNRIIVLNFSAGAFEQVLLYIGITFIVCIALLYIYIKNINIQEELKQEMR